MITSTQIRAGRGLLKWHQGVLASRTVISAVTLNMIESDQVSPRRKTVEGDTASAGARGCVLHRQRVGGFGVLLSPDRPA